MPLYQLWCDHCSKTGTRPDYEVTMRLEVFDKFSKGEIKKECPVCKKNLRNLVCPVRFKINGGYE